jgi:hypothetical protein
MLIDYLTSYPLRTSGSFVRLLCFLSKSALSINSVTQLSLSLLVLGLSSVKLFSVMVPSKEPLGLHIRSHIRFIFTSMSFMFLNFAHNTNELMGIDINRVIDKTKYNVYHRGLFCRSLVEWLHIRIYGFCNSCNSNCGCNVYYIIRNAHSGLCILLYRCGDVELNPGPFPCDKSLFLMTQNCRGLNNPTKLKQLLLRKNALVKNNLFVLALQET